LRIASRQAPYDRVNALTLATYIISRTDSPRCRKRLFAIFDLGSRNLKCIKIDLFRINFRGVKYRYAYKAKFKIFPFVSEYLDKDLTDGKFEEEYKEYMPAQFVRRMGALESLSDDKEAK